ncbi:hypothetical protein D9758_013064 [Tetrapyrgos nigripes]|uniref:Uncharacterized protein n=1 Tax=Tetrapyrgos nigripes TaxID=182062 RepID=A0A8H5CRG9_9AGAR|nr:hypothetical protein D9758_013064 [Tetrapyrgos nigripes]
MVLLSSSYMNSPCAGRERRAWSAHEDQLLRRAVELEDPANSNPSKWHAISKHVPNRTNKDCRKRWFAKMASDVVKGGWSPEEDDRLVKAIDKYGTRWSMVASLVLTRNSDQCAKRWTDTLNPSIDRTSWTPEADALLIKAVEEHGKFWTKIVKTYFPGRTGLSAKNRYNSITRFKTDSRVGRRQTSSTPVSLRVRYPSESLSSSSSSSSPVTPSATVSDISRTNLVTSAELPLQSDSHQWSSYNSSARAEQSLFEERCSALLPFQNPYQSLHTSQPHLPAYQSSTTYRPVGEDASGCAHLCDTFLLGAASSHGLNDLNVRSIASFDQRNDSVLAIKNCGYPDVYMPSCHEIRRPNPSLAPFPLSLTDPSSSVIDPRLVIANQRDSYQYFESSTKFDMHGSSWSGYGL